MEYLSPRIAVEEVDSRIRGIRRSASTTVGFVGVAEKGPVGVSVLITSFNQFRRVFGGYVEGYELAYAVENFFKYVEGRCYVIRTVHYTDITDPSTASADTSTVTIVDRANPTPVDTLKISASSPGDWGEDISVVVEEGYDDPTNTFDLSVYYKGVKVEYYKGLSMIDTNATFCETVVNNKSLYIVVEDLDSGTTTPNDMPEITSNTGSDVDLTGGDDGLTSFGATDVAGSSAGPTGIWVLGERDDISLVACPGFTDQIVHEEIVTFVEQFDKYAFGILDSPLGMDATEIEEYVRETAGFNTKECAIYYPWANQQDPSTRLPRLQPPSGHLAGIIARTDMKRGVFKAPAGTEDGRLMDVLGLERAIDRATRDILYPARINVIKSEAGIGEVVWGNRTLSYDENWKQISVRRCFQNVARSILQGTQWLVFEPNNADTQQKCRDSVYALLRGYWQEGAFYDGGSGDPDQAFYVICDSTNNSQVDINDGKLICEIGICFTRAAEFVIFRISQWDGGRIVEEVTV